MGSIIAEDYFFFPISPLGASGGRFAVVLACFALKASPLPDEVFLGFLSPMLVYTPCLRIR